MLSLLAQTYNFLPVSLEEMYADKKDCLGLEWWYEEAKEINKEIHRKSRKQT
jgi:hypothetical protein